MNSTPRSLVRTHKSFTAQRVGVAVATGPRGVAYAVARDAEPASAERFVGSVEQAVAHAVCQAIGDAGGTPTDLYLRLDDREHADGVARRLADISWLRVYVQCGALGADAYDGASALVAEPTAPAVPAAPAVPPGRLTIATDGACSRRAMGMAWVATDGAYAARGSTNGPLNPLAAELRAILLAVRALPVNQPLRLLVDSRRAIAVAESAAAGRPVGHVPPGASTVVAQLATLLPRRDVKVRWVKAHNGHPLNETADRLAVAARRAKELQQPAAARDAVFANIVADLTAGVASAS